MTESHVIDNGRLVKKNLEISTKSFEVTTEIRELASLNQESLRRYIRSRSADMEASAVQRAALLAKYARSGDTNRPMRPPVTAH